MYKSILAIVLIAFVSLPVLAQMTATSDSRIPEVTSSTKSSHLSSSVKKMKKKYAVPSRSTLKGVTQPFSSTSSASTITPRYIVTEEGAPTSGDIQGSLTANTNDVLLQSFNIRAENADLKLQKLPIILYMQKGSLAGRIPAAIRSVSLYIDGQKIATENPTNPYVVFGGLNKLQYPLSVVHGDYKVQIRVDLNDFEDSALSTVDFDPGDKVSSWYSSLKVLETVVEVSNNGKLLTSTQKIGESKGALRAVVLSGDCTPASAPSITVLSPNGGETFPPGASVTVKWKSCNIASGLVIVSLDKGTPPNVSRFSLTPQTHIPTSGNITYDDGEEVVTLPTTQTHSSSFTMGSDFKIIVYGYLNPSPSNYTGSDQSDNFFSITDGGTPATQMWTLVKSSVETLQTSAGMVKAATFKYRVKVKATPNGDIYLSTKCASDVNQNVNTMRADILNAPHSNLGLDICSVTPVGVVSLSNDYYVVNAGTEREFVFTEYITIADGVSNPVTARGNLANVRWLKDSQPSPLQTTDLGWKTGYITLSN